MCLSGERAHIQLPELWCTTGGEAENSQDGSADHAKDGKIKQYDTKDCGLFFILFYFINYIK